ncbi:MAG TPA: hypothetical protein VGO45_10545 [Bacteroidia bacterium]|jgi:hypothetical protein|nr:hypothetical protein [Bacteroidia bacterium]
MYKNDPEYISSTALPSRLINKKGLNLSKQKHKMVTVIKKGSPRQKILKLLKKMKIYQGLDAFKFCGAIHFKEDGLALQRKMRNEWK